MHPDRELVSVELDSDGNWVALAWSQRPGDVFSTLSEPGHTVDYALRLGDDLDVPSSCNIGGQRQGTDNANKSPADSSKFRSIISLRRK